MGDVGEHLPGGAMYRAVLPDNAHPMQAAAVEISVDAAPEPGGGWFSLRCTKKDGGSFSLWLLAEGNPFATGEKVVIHRYILQEGDQPPIEYVEKRSGRALLPIWGFVDELLPKAAAGEETLLFERGRYLGHPLVRERFLDSEEVRPPADVERVVLNSELLIGTSRNFRDDGTGRKTRKDNYNYVPFTRDNYDEMIDAGINYFTADEQQIEWICRRSVFYDTRGKKPKFPEELYRSNFLGRSMFIDEPACILAGKYPENADVEVAVKMIREYIEGQEGKDYYRRGLIEAGVDPGDMVIVEPMPIWETYVGTSYYQMQANPYGFVQECRWHLDPNYESAVGLILQQLNADYGVDIPLAPKSLFMWFYSQMTGPARVFNARWGMSIYGHAEPPLRLPSMELAYEMGATYIWFWTSDHDHHVPYTEQLELARAIRRYEEAHPRRPPAELTAGAKKAIVLPYGYTLPSIWQLHMWGTHLYATDRTNRLGITCKEVLRGAVRAAERCLKEGIRYDVVPAGPEFDPKVYDEVIWVHEDATLTVSRKGRGASD
jgi:hypothetical protein